MNFNAINHDSRLTDSLERELLAQAFENQYRLHPIQAVAKLLAKFKKLKAYGLYAGDKDAISQMV
jgi:hypothetical protein